MPFIPPPQKNSVVVLKLQPHTAVTFVPPPRCPSPLLSPPRRAPSAARVRGSVGDSEAGSRDVLRAAGGVRHHSAGEGPRAALLHGESPASHGPARKGRSETPHVLKMMQRCKEH